MIIRYVVNIRLPTERAHGVQIMKACEAFARAGHAVELIVPRRWSPITETPFAYYGVEPLFSIRYLGPPDLVQVGGFVGYWVQSILFTLSALVRVWGRSGIVYSRDEYVLSLFTILGVRRFVWESHDGAWNVFARFVARRAQRMVVVSKGARDFYAARGISRERILAVSNGIDLTAFEKTESKEEARTRLGIPEGRVAMYVGSLEGWKGVTTLFEASERLPNDVRVVVIGGDEKELPALRKQHPRVMFLGPRPYRELPQNLAAADICILPNTAKEERSLAFTSPLKLLAYMAAGKPVVASDLPSVRDVAGETVLLVTPDDPQVLANGIRELLDNTEHARQLAVAAHGRVQAFSWNIRAQTILSFLETK